MGFAEGLIAGSSAARSAIGAGTDTMNAIQQARLNQEQNEQIVVQKENRDFGQNLQKTMAAAAGDQTQAAPTAQPTGSFNDMVNGQQLSGQQDGLTMPSDPMGANAAVGAATGNTGMADSRPEWQRRVDAYSAGRDFAIKSGRPEVAADMVHQVASTRTAAAQLQAQTGYRQWIASGQTDPSGLLQAFNTVDDGVKATGIVPGPDGKSVTLQMQTADGRQISKTVANADVPSLMAQYFDPQAMYQRQVQVQAEQAGELFKSHLKIGEKTAEQQNDLTKELALKEAERSGRAPTISMRDRGDGMGQEAIVNSPNAGGGSTVAPMTPSGPEAPRLSKQDEAVHAAIFKTAQAGISGGMIAPTPEVKAATEVRQTGAMDLYDANRKDPNIGALNEGDWLALHDAISSKNPSIPVSTRVNPATGQTLRTVDYKGLTLALDDPAVPRNVTKLSAPSALSGPSSPRAGSTTPPVVQGIATQVPPAVQAARDGDRIGILQSELADKQTRLQTLQADTSVPATPAEQEQKAGDLHRVQMDVQALTSEINNSRGRPGAAVVAPARGSAGPRAPAVAQVSPVAQVAPAAQPVMQQAAPVSAAPQAITRPTSPGPQNQPAPATASQAAARGTIKTPDVSVAAVSRDTQRLQLINATIAASKGQVDPSLVQERQALMERLGKTATPSASAASAERNAAYARAGVPMMFNP